MDKRGKKAQVTIFIIIAIIIVVLGILIYMFYPKIKASFGFECHNEAYGIGNKEVQFGNERYVNFAERFVCSSNFGFSK